MAKKKIIVYNARNYATYESRHAAYYEIYSEVLEEHGFPSSSFSSFSKLFMLGITVMLPTGKKTV